MFDLESSQAYQWLQYGDVMVVLAVPGASIEDEVWDRFVSDLRESETGLIFAMTTRNCATANSTQRKIASDVMKEKSIMTIVVTDDRVTRGVLTALSWVGAMIKGYPWDQLSDALTHIKDPETRAKIASFSKKATHLQSP